MTHVASPEPAGDIADLVRSRIRDVADYPKPGIVFKDITPLLADPSAFQSTVEALGSPWLGASPAVDKVVGIEARGFILAAPVALALGAGFVPVRKAGKLPSAVLSRSYALEYGEATLQVHRDAFAPGERVLVVDDVLATGGTVEATTSLIREAGAEVVGVSVLLELAFLAGRARLEGQDGFDVRALLTVSD
ncbi:adenine phosphoribosyltransferase [Tenggerimyces flavus]|uniref:Adenine phosphoribosyltransferase n=1 Tax=Tenggerimyces flavus TaxID=1708749 RepID=A0ABV7YDC7_9ACTN|nr:adenine phosphoribosyltransferase [Tenggerimyces flavus]MBM7787906.1 adenine phosphoribosyltransferase [Tenggerimyces flavus]